MTEQYPSFLPMVGQKVFWYQNADVKLAPAHAEVEEIVVTDPPMIHVSIRPKWAVNFGARRNVKHVSDPARLTNPEQAKQNGGFDSIENHHRRWDAKRAEERDNVRRREAGEKERQEQEKVRLADYDAKIGKLYSEGMPIAMIGEIASRETGRVFEPPQVLQVIERLKKEGKVKEPKKVAASVA